MKPFWLATVCILLCASPCATVAQEPSEKHVLVLFDRPEKVSAFLKIFAPAVRARVPGRITFYQEYVVALAREDQTHVSEQERNDLMESQAETLRRRYAGLKLDLVVATDPWALQFSVQYRNGIFPGVPIVFTGLGSRQFAGKTWPRGVTGVTVPVGLRETIDLALRLQPDTETVAVISPQDPFWIEATHTELLRYKGRIKEIFLLAPPISELFKKVVALPPHTVVLFHLSPPPNGQPELAGMDLIDAVSERVPTYSAWELLCLDHGCIGGAYPDHTKLILRTAEIASRVLLGARPDDIPVVDASDVQVEVDSRSLSRWHIPESALPPGSQVLYREPTPWERGRKYFLTGIAVIVLQALLIFALFWQQARRRKAEIELARSEQKFSKAFLRSPLAITIVSASDGRYIDVNEAFEIQTGWKRDEVIGHSPQELNLWVNPDQQTAFMKQLVDQGNVKDLEVRLRRKDGQIRTALGSAELIDVHGEPCALSVIADITERKQAEEAMAGFSRRLIEAQETERTRIARELHDDINQRLAMVAISLKTAKEGLPNSEVKTSRILEEAGERVSELETDVQALSHRLHSSKLEYLGLEAASSGFCRELSERQNVKIDLQCEGVPEELSSEVSLCLFRVLQEALHNAAKYSGVNEFEVALNGASHEIQLRVHDSGVGFDARRASNGHGLGLTSMKERLKLVSGELSIDSELGHGTTVLARVPLGDDTTAAGAAA